MHTDLPLVPAERVVTETTARVIHVRFRPSGWATFTICESTGELSVQSDWGSWSYRWHVGARAGLGLAEALARFDRDYVARKLEPDPEEICLEATRQNLRREVLEARREGRIDAEHARDLWDSSNYFCDVFEERCPSAALDDAPRDLQRFFGGEIYERFGHRDRHRFQVLRDGLLPVLREHLTAAG